ncbi:MAG: 16S rRNA (adenine(1518)-N(6)/adenine(1519)-N(6))-dimethyltransferase RsmA [Bacteroidales bacterium]|nr:16S rRNA (adenine(1518)-N(6)/adenine(1519)-N(6))-dimethyltransferase RsmA [Bacteroidales bacterium]
MEKVRAKKSLGQHFLTDEGIARRIVDSLAWGDGTSCQQQVLEVGPGMGVLTKYLLEDKSVNLCAVEVDQESVAYLHEHFPSLRVVAADFLKIDLSTLFESRYALIGNFPYNISSQILFRVFDNRDIIPVVVGMFQKEVAERVAAAPGNKSYGILSVLLTAYYDIEYLFTVEQQVFNPPPKVKSAVIRLRRNGVTHLDCNEKLFIKVVKAGFGQRRKTMRNALRTLGLSLENIPANMLAMRAEQLGVDDFVSITKILQLQ